MRPFLARPLAIAAALLGAGLAQAQVTVQDAWVRATVPQQKATGAFVQLRAEHGSRLVSARSPLTPTVEIHEMRVENDVMRMRQIQGLDLPAGQAVVLKPGGHHLMLLNLAAQVKEGDTVPLTLEFTDAQGRRSAVEVQAPVRALTAAHGQGHGHGHPGAGGAGGHGSHGGHSH